MKPCTVITTEKCPNCGHWDIKGTLFFCMLIRGSDGYAEPCSVSDWVECPLKEFTRLDKRG